MKDHRKQICIDTMRMNDTFANIMGGPTKHQAYEYLCSIGYKDSYMEEYEKEMDIDRNWDDQYDSWKERQQFEGEI